MVGMAKLFLSGFALAGADNICPGSTAMFHAKQQVQVQVSASCADVQQEMLDRISGVNGWVDPHNAGTYTVLETSAGVLKAKRVTGNKKYTDLLNFAFSASEGGCYLKGCSESQTFSVADFSTNLCNLHDLYCGSQDGCPVARKDLKYTETISGGSAGAGKDKAQCVASSVRSLFLN